MDAWFSLIDLLMKIIFNSGYFCLVGILFVSDKFVLLISTELHLFIFEITQDCIIIFFKAIGRKQTSKISKLFPCKHKIDESNAKIPTHYWIFCLYSKNVSFYVFVPDKFFNFFRKVFNTITIKINNFTSFTKQSNPVCTYVCVFIKVYYLCPMLYFFRQIISRIHTIES